jgi:hypothetical protein
MKTSELIKELQTSLEEDGDQEIFLSSDPEGNYIRSIHELAQVTIHDDQPEARNVITIYPTDNVINL